MVCSKEYTIQLDGKAGSPNRKYTCPQCGKKGRLRRYYNYETKQYLADDVGLCDRPKCGYHKTPREFFEAHPTERKLIKIIQGEQYTQKPKVNIPFEILKRTLKDYNSNSLINSLRQFYPIHDIERVIADYYLGTVKAGFKGEAEDSFSTVFWFINNQNEIRAGQVKLFDSLANTAKYIDSEGERRNYQTWVHTLLEKHYKGKSSELPSWLIGYKEQELRVDCLFGEHLLEVYPHKPIALVEAPKTAIIGALTYPSHLWLATSSLTYLTKQRCEVLRDRTVDLFPDAGIPNPKTGKTCLQLWKERVEEFKHIANFRFSTLIEERATQEQKEKGFDLADLILDDLRAVDIRLFGCDVLDVLPPSEAGPEYGNLSLYTVCMKNGSRYEILADSTGEPICTHESIVPFSEFFQRQFTPAKFEGIDCLINIIKDSSQQKAN